MSKTMQRRRPKKKVCPVCETVVEYDHEFMILDGDMIAHRECVENQAADVMFQ